MWVSRLWFNRDMYKNRVAQRGFTIVELLIVVVVIAILAAITMVAYTGIRQQATNSQIVSAANAYVKAIRAYTAKNSGTPPMTTGAVSCFEGTTCWSGSDEAGSTGLQANLLTVVSEIPSMPTGYPALITSATTGDSPNSSTYTGWYILFQVSDSSCPSIGGTRYLNTSGNNNLRSCRMAVEL